MLFVSFCLITFPRLGRYIKEAFEIPGKTNRNSLPAVVKVVRARFRKQTGKIDFVTNI